MLFPKYFLLVFPCNWIDLKKKRLIVWDWEFFYDRYIVDYNNLGNVVLLISLLIMFFFSKSRIQNLFFYFNVYSKTLCDSYNLRGQKTSVITTFKLIEWINVTDRYFVCLKSSNDGNCSISTILKLHIKFYLSYKVWSHYLLCVLMYERPTMFC